jgi:hypothetical protein
MHHTLSSSISIKGWMIFGAKKAKKSWHIDWWTVRSIPVLWTATTQCCSGPVLPILQATENTRASDRASRRRKNNPDSKTLRRDGDGPPGQVQSTSKLSQNQEAAAKVLDTLAFSGCPSPTPTHHQSPVRQSGAAGGEIALVHITQLELEQWSAGRLQVKHVLHGVAS